MPPCLPLRDWYEGGKSDHTDKRSVLLISRPPKFHFTLNHYIFTAADLVTHLEKAQKQYTLDRFLDQLERTHLLICDELGYVSLSRGGVELLFRVFADRYERGSMLITTNLPFGEWNQIFQGERMTAALLDRLTHRCHIFEMNGESYRFRESMKSKKSRKTD
jgi:DNA replication protein DnaC